MKRLRGATVGVDQGNVELFSEFASGGDMWVGSGSRERRKWIEFSAAYRDIPSVHLSLSLWDMDSNANVRADLTAENIGLKGFDMVFRTWGDTRVARIRADWLAIGPLRHVDDFDL